MFNKFFKSKGHQVQADNTVVDLRTAEFKLPASIKDRGETISFLGVELQKRAPGKHTPELERFKKNILTEFDVKLMQKIAVAFDLNQPVLIESGSGLGKTETVERMCAMLGWECYYANCHDFEADVLIGSKTVREDTKSGFGWKDGIVLQAIRNGGVLYLDEYNFMRGETRGRLHEVLDSILRGKTEVILIENDGEVVPVHPNFRIVCSQNPPGDEFSDREVLDPAQISRFVYIKEPTLMPRELKSARMKGLIDDDVYKNELKRYQLKTQQSISLQQLRELEDIDLAWSRFLDFEESMEKLVSQGYIGSDQPQPIYFSFQRDFQRLLDFIVKYFDGDIFSTMQKGLYYYYVNRFELQKDRQKVMELIKLVSRDNKNPPNKNNITRQNQDDFEEAA